MNPFANVLGQLFPAKPSSARPAASVPVSTWPAPTPKQPLTLRKGGAASAHPLPPLAAVRVSAQPFAAPERVETFAVPRPLAASVSPWSAPAPKAGGLMLRRDPSIHVAQELPRPPAPAERQLCRTC